MIFTLIDNGVSKTLKSCTLWIKKATITPSLKRQLKRAGLVNFRDVGSLAGINEQGVILKFDLKLIRQGT